MRLPDSRRLYTASSGIRSKWPLGRRSPLYFLLLSSESQLKTSVQRKLTINEIFFVISCEFIKYSKNMQFPAACQQKLHRKFCFIDNISKFFCGKISILFNFWKITPFPIIVVYRRRIQSWSFFAGMKSSIGKDALMSFILDGEKIALRR